MNRQNLQVLKGSYPYQSHSAFLSAPSNQQLVVHSVTAYNGTAADNSVGVCLSLNNSDWKLFTLGASDTDVTSSIQAGSAVSILPTTNNYGFLVQAKSKFELVSINISQIQTGSPVYTYEYWNGSSWSTLSLKNTPSYASTGIQAILFDAPIDWAIGDGSEGGSDDLYSIRVLGTTAPSQAVQINSMKVCEVVSLSDKVAPYASVNVDFDTRQLLLQQGEAIVGFFLFGSTLNTMEANYQINP